MKDQGKKKKRKVDVEIEMEEVDEDEDEDEDEEDEKQELENEQDGDEMEGVFDKKVELLQEQAQKCLGVVTTTQRVGGKSQFRTIINPLLGLLLKARQLKDDAAGHAEVLKVAGEAFRTFVRRICRLKLGPLHMSSLARLVIAIEKVASPIFQFEIASAAVDLRSKLLVVKRDVILQSNSPPSLRLVLEIDALPLAERISRLNEIGTAIKLEFLKVAKKDESLVSEGVLLAITWLDELTPALATKQNSQIIGKFADTLLASIGLLSSLTEINILRSSALSVKLRLKSSISDVRFTSSMGLPSEHPAYAIVRQLLVLPHTERNECLGELIEALEFDFWGAPQEVAKGYHRQVCEAVTAIVQWILSQPLNFSHTNDYERICRAVQKLGLHFPLRSQYFQKLSDPLLTTLVRLKLIPSTSSAPEKIGEEMPDDCIARARVLVTAMQARPALPIEVHQVTKLLIWVFKVCTCESNWNPKADPEVLEIVINLRKCVNTMQARKVGQREKHGRFLDKWIAMLSENSSLA